MSAWRSLLPNAWIIAAREYRTRVASGAFIAGTVILAAIAFAVTQAPIIIDYVSGTSQTRIAILVRASDPPKQGAAVLDNALNGGTGAGGHKEYVLTVLSSADLSPAQVALDKGTFDGLIVVDRDPATGNLAFTLRTDMPSDGRQVVMITSALHVLAIEDGLERAGTSTADVLAPANLKVVPARTSGTATTSSLSQSISASLLTTGLIVLIFMAIVTYGAWVAMSVAEEKGSRVMELMLNATTPIQMLAGKVIGHGAAGLSQYGIVLAAVVAGLAAQQPLRQAILGSSSDLSLGGLQLPVLGTFIVFFVLGFLLYSLLYAALGSLVSRQEDVTSATSPLMVVIMLGYFMSVAAVQSTNDTWVVVMSFVPFFSPYMMLARVSAGHVQPWEIGLAVVLLLAAIGIALTFAARVYSAGVLLYGQRVGVRQILRAARASR